MRLFFLLPSMAWSCSAALSSTGKILRKNNLCPFLSLWCFISRKIETFINIIWCRLDDEKLINVFSFFLFSFIALDAMREWERECEKILRNRREILKKKGGMIKWNCEHKCNKFLHAKERNMKSFFALHFSPFIFLLLFHTHRSWYSSKFTSIAPQRLEKREHIKTYRSLLVAWKHVLKVFNVHNNYY